MGFLKIHWMMIVLILSLSSSAFATSDCDGLFSSLKSKLTSWGQNYFERNSSLDIEYLDAAIQNPQLRAQMRDYLSHHWIRSKNPNDFISLSLGHASSRYSDADLEILKAHLLDLVSKGYSVMYDGESSVAPYISEVLKDKGLAIVGSEASKKKLSKSAHVAVISNNFMRMSALTHARNVIVGTDSIAGRALVLWAENVKKGGEGTKAVTHFINLDEDDDLAFQFVDELYEWSKEDVVKERGLGIRKVKNDPTILELDDSFEISSYDRRRNPVLDFSNTEDMYRSLKSKLSRREVLVPLQRFLKDMEEGTELLNQTLKAAGVGLMGSSREDPDSAESVYQLARALGEMGISVSTGGSGGAMWEGVMGNKDGGGLSVGVPIKGRAQPENEDAVPTDDQSLTVYTSDYNSRIQFLIGHVDGLGAKPIVFYVPGGLGTMKELAVHLMAISMNQNSNSQIVFMDHEYYGGLYNSLVSSGLPNSVVERLHLIDNESPEQVFNDTQSLVNSLMSTGVISRDDLVSVENPKPNMQRTSYPMTVVEEEEE